MKAPIPGENVDSLFTQAQIEIMVNNDTETASALFKKVLALQPGNAVAHSQLSRISLLNKNIPQALKEIKKALKADPEQKEYLDQYASILFYQGNYDKAAKIFAGLAKKENGTESLWKEEQCYAADGQFAKALSVVEKAEQLEGTPDRDEFIEKIKLYLQLGNRKKPVAIAEYLVATFPDDPRNYIRLAYLYNYFGNFKRCDSLFISAIKKFPENFNLFFDATMYFLQRKNEGVKSVLDYVLYSGKFSPDERRLIFVPLAYFRNKSSMAHVLLYEYLPKVCRANPSDTELLSFYAYVLSEDKQSERSMKINKEIIAVDSGNRKAWNHLLSYYVNKLYGEDIKVDSGRRCLDTLVLLSRKAIAAFPDKPDPYSYLASGYLNVQEADSALVYFKKGLQLVSDTDTAWIFYLNKSLGSIYASQNKMEAAIKSFQKAYTCKPYNVSLLNDYSFALAEEGTDLDKALAMSAKCLFTLPNEPVYLDTYGWILFRQKKYKDAARYLRKAIKLTDKADPVLYEHLGDIERALGHNNRAKECWLKAKEAGGNQKELLQKIKEINR